MVQVKQQGSEECEGMMIILDSHQATLANGYGSFEMKAYADVWPAIGGSEQHNASVLSRKLKMGESELYASEQWRDPSNSQFLANAEKIERKRKKMEAGNCTVLVRAYQPGG